MSEGMDQLRTTLKSLGDVVVTAPLLGEVLGLTTESERQVIRRRLREMIQRGEVEKVGTGQFRFIEGKERPHKGNGYSRMWRVIRAQTPGWRKANISAITRLDRTSVDRYVTFLEDEGLVARSGRDGNTILWRTTSKARDQRQTPWPKADCTIPYSEEKSAAGTLCMVMLRENPDQPSTRNKIRRCLAILTAKFGTQLENIKNEQPQGETYVE